MSNDVFRTGQREVQLAYGGESDVWAVDGGVALWEYKFSENG